MDYKTSAARILIGGVDDIMPEAPHFEAHVSLLWMKSSASPWV
jgi:hypothetical protein